MVYKKIDFSEQNQQLCNCLNEDMKTYVNEQKPKMISKVIHHAMVAAKIFTSSKGFPKQVDHQEKTNDKDQAMWDAKLFGNKDSKPKNAKNKDRSGYKGHNPLTLEVMEKYQKENWFFWCDEQGHNYHDCSKKKTLKDTPQVTHILSRIEKEEEVGGCTHLCYLKD